MNKATKPSDYKHIAAWGHILGSFASYVVDQQRRAFAAGAPIDAVYEEYCPNGATGKWHTISDCVPSTQERVQQVIEYLATR